MFPKRYIIQSYKQPIWTLRNCWDEQLSKPQIDHSRIGTAELISLLFLSIRNCFMFWLRGCLQEKTHTGASFIPGWLFDFVSRLHDDWVISYLVIWRYTSCWCNIRVIQNRKHYACATRSSPPADPFSTETGGCFAFTWHRCEIS